MRKLRKTGKVTIFEVAAEAGVSAITVSRALRNPGNVSDQAVARIQAAVAKLGYTPDPAAQALASKRSSVIAALIPSLTNSVFSDVLRGLQDTFEASRYQLQLANTRYSPQTEEKLIRTFLGQRPAGLIVSGIDQSPTSRAMLEQAQCPIVQIMDTAAAPVDMMIGFSHRDAARAAVEHLVAAGYRHIAFLGARMDPRTLRRLDGFRDALQPSGLLDEALVRTTPEASSVSLGSRLLRELLELRPDADAVFCNNDDIALGALFEAQRQGLAVPGRLGICGFNDMEMMEAAFPSITSVRTHRHRMGIEAARMLMQAIDGTRPDISKVDLGFEVMTRQSTRR
jgi:LacI family gluconate utilization system Gnt-I transcriptional repressor